MSIFPALDDKTSPAWLTSLFSIKVLAWDQGHPDVAHEMMHCIKLLIDENVPHNLVLTARKAFLFPRKSCMLQYHGTIITPGFPEFAG